MMFVMRMVSGLCPFIFPEKNFKGDLLWVNSITKWKKKLAGNVTTNAKKSV